MVLREVCLLLAVAALAQGDGHDELCSRVAFEPLTKHLTCGTDCTAENVSVVWTFDKVVAPVANATFRYGSPHEIHGSSIKYESVEVLADGRLRIGTVKEASHKGDYSCTAQFSNGTVCGMTDSFSLRVTQLFTDLSQSPSFKPERDTDATYGLRKVLCVDGDSPGIDENRTYWEKTDVVNVVVNNISAECLSTYPTLCYSCDDQNKYLSLPTVMNQTMNYEYSAFVIASRHIQGDTKHNECLDITNTYVSFLVINEVKNEDKGTFKVIIESGYNTRNAEGPYTLLPSYITIESEVQDLTDKKIDAGENAYVICNATHSVDPAPSLHWKFIGVNPDKSVLDIPSTVVTNVNRSSLDNISISDDKLSELCNNYTDMLGDRGVAFSIDFAPNEELYENSIDHGNAVIQRRYLVLVLCNVTKEQDGTYTCVAPAIDSRIAKSEKIMEVMVFDDTPTVVVGGSTSTNPAAIAGVVVAAVIIMLDDKGNTAVYLLYAFTFAVMMTSMVVFN